MARCQAAHYYHGTGYYCQFTCFLRQFQTLEQSDENNAVHIFRPQVTPQFNSSSSYTDTVCALPIRCNCYYCHSKLTLAYTTTAGGTGHSGVTFTIASPMSICSCRSCYWWCCQSTVSFSSFHLPNYAQSRSYATINTIPLSLSSLYGSSLCGKWLDLVNSGHIPFIY